MYLYVYEGYRGGKGGQQRTEDLVRRATKLYMKEEQFPEKFSDQILRAERGKPYFKECSIEFSVSHTSDLWVCLMDSEPVGVDVQVIRKCRSEQVARRYYTGEEQAYIRTEGEQAFFQIWTRKEAYAKYTGRGLTEDIKDFSTLQESSVKFVDFDIREGIKGSCCMRRKKELWIRKIT